MKSKTKLSGEELAYIVLGATADHSKFRPNCCKTQIFLKQYQRLEIIHLP